MKADLKTNKQKNIAAVRKGIFDWTKLLLSWLGKDKTSCQIMIFSISSISWPLVSFSYKSLKLETNRFCSSYVWDLCRLVRKEPGDADASEGENKKRKKSFRCDRGLESIVQRRLKRYTDGSAAWQLVDSVNL